MFSKKRLLIVIPILWLGFILSISFMEAWLKFQAEGVTQQIALSIGKLVFGVLNKVEALFFLIIVIVVYGLKLRLPKKTKRNIVLTLGAILLIQTFHLIPILDERANLIINGNQASGSYFHFYYVALEVLKVVLLITFITNVLSSFVSSELKNNN